MFSRQHACTQCRGCSSLPNAISRWEEIKNLCRGGVSPPDSKGENFCSQGERRLFEGTIPPSKRLFHHSVHGDRTVEPRTPPKDRSLPWVSLPLLVNAEVGLQSQPTSIACQRYHTPDSPHLRHGRPPRCSLVAFHRPNWSNQRQKEGRGAFFVRFLPQK